MVFVGTACFPSSLGAQASSSPPVKKSVDDPSCTLPPEQENAYRDICIIDPGAMCAGYEVGCLYVDPNAGCIYISCRQSCESAWEFKHKECVQAPTPKKSYSEQTEEHGI
jgi:hypothetical protein